MGDDAKKTILARRARFIAAAMAVAGCGNATPSADTPQKATADAGAPVTEPPPAPCLSPVPGPNYPLGAPSK